MDRPTGVSPYVAQAARACALDISVFWYDGRYIIDAVSTKNKYLRREAHTPAAALRAYSAVRDMLTAERAA